MQIGLPVVQLYLIGFEAHITLLVEWALTCSLEYLKKKEPRIQYFIFEQSFVFTPATKQQSNPNLLHSGHSLFYKGLFQLGLVHSEKSSNIKTCTIDAKLHFLRILAHRDITITCELCFMLVKQYITFNKPVDFNRHN